MNKTELLLQRLDEIGQSLKDSKQALAFLAPVLAEQKERIWTVLGFRLLCYCKDGYKQNLYPRPNLVK